MEQRSDVAKVVCCGPHEALTGLQCLVKDNKLIFFHKDDSNSLFFSSFVSYIRQFLG